MNMNVEKQLTEKEASKIIGVLPNETHYDTLIKEKCIAKDNGEFVFAYIPNAIPNKLIQKAYSSLKSGCTLTNNRASATFKGSTEYAIKKDGTRSRSHRTIVEVRSGIGGFFDRYARTPYCRMCAFTEKNPDKWAKILPIIHIINKYYEKYSPELYKNQKLKIEKTSQDFVIKDTAFTTTTFNMNYRTAFHRDRGNLTGGCAGMGVFGAGNYTGCHLCFPEYKIAIDIRPTDVIVMNNTTLIHGNTELICEYGEYERISLVCYMREKMMRCGTIEQEIERAKKYGAKISEELY